MPQGKLKVLIAGAHGYVGQHVVRYFKKQGIEPYVWRREQQTKACTPLSVSAADTELHQQFDVVINCARPHWADYSPEEIANIEQNLVAQLEQFAKPKAVKIHTSGVWLFGLANPAQLEAFEWQPFESVALDVATLQGLRERHWHIVYCPSLIYGGENCQLKRSVQEQKSGWPVALPSRGHHQYVHVVDLARCYYQLSVQNVQDQPREMFIAESLGFSPEQLAHALREQGVIDKVEALDWDAFSQQHGHAWAQVEALNLILPIDRRFVATHALCDYLAQL